MLDFAFAADVVLGCDKYARLYAEAYRKVKKQTNQRKTKHVHFHDNSITPRDGHTSIGTLPYLSISSATLPTRSIRPSKGRLSPMPTMKL